MEEKAMTDGLIWVGAGLNQLWDNPENWRRQVLPDPSHGVEPDNAPATDGSGFPSGENQ